MSDLTLQANGQLNVLLKLDWNASGIYNLGQLTGMRVAFDSIKYGPPNEPPPTWTPKKQYSAINSPNIPGFGAMIPRQGYSQQAGYAGVVMIPDMSINTVVSGKTYAFTVNVMYNWIQLYFLITGTPTGSTLLPGFGLWNLNTNPNAWSYIHPEQFTGEWEIELLSPQSAAPVWLSIEYAAAKDYGQGSIAKLIFSCTGGTMTDGWWSTINQDNSPSTFTETSVSTGTQYIHERSDSYILRSASGETLGEN